MQTHVWGPLQWLFLHIISFNYPENPTIQQKIQYWEYLMSLRNVLPCRHCRENMQDNLVAAGVSYDKFDGREAFSKFIFNFHNKVSLNLGKKEWNPNPGQDPYLYLREQMECIRARCSNKPTQEGVEKGCTEPVILGCPACVNIKLGPRTEKRIRGSVEFFGNIFGTSRS